MRQQSQDFESISMIKTLSHMTVYLTGVWRLKISSSFNTNINYFTAMKRSNQIYRYIYAHCCVFEILLPTTIRKARLELDIFGF